MGMAITKLSRNQVLAVIRKDEADIKPLEIRDMDLSGTNLSAIANALMHGVFKNVNLGDVKLIGSDLRWAKFEKTVVDEKTYISGADFSHADISGINNFEKCQGIATAVFYDIIATDEQRESIRQSKNKRRDWV